MTSDRRTEIGHSDWKVMLKDGVIGPSVSSRFTVMHVLAIGEDMTFTTVQRPDEDDFMFAAATSRTGQTFRNGLVVGNAKFKRDALLGKAKGFRGVLDTVIYLIRNEGCHGG